MDPARALGWGVLLLLSLIPAIIEWRRKNSKGRLFRGQLKQEGGNIHDQIAALIKLLESYVRSVPKGKNTRRNKPPVDFYSKSGTFPMH